jgi:hypothetical protein
MTDKFNIFRVYQENHPESLDFKPPIRQSAKEIDFSPKTVLSIQTPTVSKPLSIAPLVDEMAGQIDATEEINRVTDINEMIAAGNFPAAEWLLGRKLTMEELREKMVRDLMKAPEKLEQQLRNEIMREKKKAELLKKIQDEEAQKNALLNPPPSGPHPNPNAPPPPPPPSGPPGGAPGTPQKPPAIPPRPPKTPQNPPAPGPPAPAPGPPPTNMQLYLEDLDGFGIDGVTAAQLLASDTNAAAVELVTRGVAQADLPPLLMSHALARFEFLHGSSSSSSGPAIPAAHDKITQAIGQFEQKWNQLNMAASGWDLGDAFLASAAEFEKLLLQGGVSPSDVNDMLDMHAELRTEFGFPASSSAPAAPAPAPAAVFTMPPMGTDAEKLASSQMMAQSFALAKDPKGGLSPQQIYDAVKLYKQYTAAVKADFDATIGTVSNPPDRAKKAFRTNYSGFRDIASSKANKPDLGKVIARIDDEAANKLQELTTNALKYGIKTGTGVRKMRADWVPFGDKFLINMDKFRRGIFALGYATTRQPPQWARGGIELTRPLRHVIQAFLDGEPLDLSELDEREKA